MDQVGQIIVSFPSSGKPNVTIKGKIDARRFNSLPREIQMEYRKYIVSVRKARAAEEAELIRIASTRATIINPQPASKASSPALSPAAAGFADAKPKAEPSKFVSKPMREPEPAPIVPLIADLEIPELEDELVEEDANNNKKG